jgi:N-acyl-D-aspartate/D-glutamate deacylase
MLPLYSNLPRKHRLLNSPGLVFTCILVILLAGCSPPSETPVQAKAHKPVAVAEPLDLVLAGGRVIDPESGLDAIRHVGIRDGEIVAVSETPLGGKIRDGGELLDVTGLVVVPGFIDLHAHGQSAKAHEFQARDGVTTALELEWGYPSVGVYLADREGRSRVNYGASASHGMTRALAMSESGERESLHQFFDVAATADEPLSAVIAFDMESLYQSLPPEKTHLLHTELERGLTEGALGIGMAHQYYPGANREEIFRVFQFAAKKNVPIFVHVRSMSIDAMQEVIANAAITGAPLHIVHINSMSLGNIATVLDLIAAARARGIDITTEVYPYTAASTVIDAAIFDGDWQTRLNISYGDIQWQDTGERLTKESYERYRGSGGVVIMHMMKEEWVRQAIGTPWVIIASDGMPYAPGAHPRTAGTFSRVLGRYVREQGVIDLPTAIRKMTLMPAQRLETVAPQMARKGRLQAGFDADITVFDANTVIDTATFEEGLSFSEGIHHVLVGGVPVVLNGETVADVYPGKAIRGDSP